MSKTSAGTSREGQQKAFVKPVDSWWTVLVIDTLAVRLVPLLARLRWVTPMGLTLASAVAGAAAAAAFELDALPVGAILFELKFVLDCLDGKLARARDVTSATGGFVDAFLDVLITTACYVTLTRAAFDGAGTPTLAVLLAGGVMLEVWTRLYPLPPRSPSRSAPATGTQVLRRLQTLMARRRLVLLPSTVELETAALFLLPLTGQRELVRIGLVVAAVSYTVFVLLQGRRAIVRLRAHDRSQT